MRVVLMRHGPAGERDAERWPDDRLRALTPRGEKRTRAAANGIVRLEAGIATIFTSPLVRALATAQLLAKSLAHTDVETLDSLRPGGSYRHTIESLTRIDRTHTVVLIGHEPDLGKLAGMLLFGAPTPLPLRKAGACSIQFDAEVRAGAGRLNWFMPPKSLRRLARRKDKV